MGKYFYSKSIFINEISWWPHEELLAAELENRCLVTEVI
jgi:hypothetical protein